MIGTEPGLKLRSRTPWRQSDRFIARKVLRPAQRLMQLEAAGPLIMFAAAVVALAWANSPWSTSYQALWDTAIRLEVGQFQGLSGLTAREWVTDGAMTLFFFVVALEIKREMVSGELRDPRAAALPVVAALGGMVVPALIYLAINAGGPGAHGWGIPMATDIAFAVAIVVAAGRHVPLGARLFLLTLAVVDDLGAILVIAVFYTGALALPWLILALSAFAGAAFLRRAQVRWQPPYPVLAALCWYALFKSGVNPTLAGVAFGFLTSARPTYDPRQFGEQARALVSAADGTAAEQTESVRTRDQQAIRDLGRLSAGTRSQLERLEYRLTPWITFLVLPVFALATAGLNLPGDALTAWLYDDVALGVAVGLIVGKTVGVFAATWLCVKSGLARLPAHTGWRHMLGVSMCAGVGFTVALFVSALAFTTPALTEASKMGILAGSLIASVLGFSMLRWGVGPRVSRSDQRGHLRDDDSALTQPSALPT